MSWNSPLTLTPLAALIWRLVDPTVVTHLAGLNILYTILVFLLLPMVVVVASYGALLTFPLHTRDRQDSPAGSG